MDKLFSKHIDELMLSTEKYLSAHGIPGLALAAGEAALYFEDDHGPAFKTNSHFRHWCPALGEGHIALIRPGNRPCLLAYCPDDFWHLIQKFGRHDFWSSSYEVKVFNDKEKISDFILKNCKDFVFHGEHSALKLRPASLELIAWLNWRRSFKTEYEIHCLQVASEKASLGHKVAKDIFLSGGSELDIYFEYLKAVRSVEAELPYIPIIGLNQNASILHYHGKNDSVRNARSLLIDAGASYNGYGSDITRTYAAPHAHPVFKTLVDQMELAQKRLCHSVGPKTSNLELHINSHQEVAKVLVENKIVQGLSSEDVVELELSKIFYPHGIGHLLGIQVHDVGGHQKDSAGEQISRSEKFPNIRCERVLQENNYLTIEPGLYFIPSLLEECKASKFSKNINWKLVQELISHGGIRVEDNILVTKSGSTNLTREYLNGETSDTRA